MEEYQKRMFLKHAKGDRFQLAETEEQVIIGSLWKSDKVCNTGWVEGERWHLGSLVRQCPI